VFWASSHAIDAETIGLRGKATAIPVEKWRLGAAIAAAAIFIHGTSDVSVYNIPENPLASSRRAKSAVSAQVPDPVIRSNSTFPSALRRYDTRRAGRQSQLSPGSIRRIPSPSPIWIGGLPPSPGRGVEASALGRDGADAESARTRQIDRRLPARRHEPELTPVVVLDRDLGGSAEIGFGHRPGGPRRS
jgi:hypothetical protein